MAASEGIVGGDARFGVIVIGCLYSALAELRVGVV